MKIYVLTNNIFYIFSLLLTVHLANRYTEQRNQKPKKIIIMKKAVIAGVVGVFALGMLSCGGGSHGCDAYRKADYTKYKENKTLKMEFIDFTKKVKKEKK